MLSCCWTAMLQSLLSVAAAYTHIYSGAQFKHVGPDPLSMPNQA